MYEIVLHPRAEKELDKVPSKDFLKIDRTILELKDNPRPHGVKKLDAELHRIRVGDWRIIYSIFDHEKRVVILRVARRNERTYS